jgi:hypothetical protein
MADLKISELSALAGANLVAADELAIVDDSASETKKITVSDLIANGVTVISDDSIPGAKILFGAGDIATAALADSAVTTAKVADDAITAAKLANESTVDLVTTLPTAGAFTGQLALDTDDNNVYLWDGSAWRGIAAPGSIGNINGSTTGEINIVVSTSGSAVTISATLDNTTSAAQFLAGPTGSAGAVGYRTLVGSDLPTATTTAKGGVIVNGNGLTMDGDTIEVDNSVTASSTNHIVTYDANGLITGGRTIIASDLPLATATAVGAVSVGDGLAVGAGGELSVDNTVTAGTYTKVTVTSKGLVTSATTLAAADIPDHSAAKLTSGTIGTSLIANDSVTADKLADSSTMKFGGALGSDNVTIFPTGDFKGQLFWDETSLDLYFYSGSSFVPITVLSGNLVNAGTYNANTNLVSSVTTAGSSAGFTAGSALPAPVGANLNHYVVVDTSGTGSGAAPSVALAPPDMLLSNGVGTEYRLIDVSNAIAGQTASNISFIASGTIAATDVQAALQEVDTEKLAKAGGTMSGNLELGAGIVIVFEGSAADDYETTLTVTNPTADRTITFPDTTGTVVTTGDTGSVTSTMITDGTIVNADINASAEIAVSKLANGTARQLLQTAANGSDVEFTSNVDVPGTLDVTAAATFDSTVAATGLISANGKVSFPAGTAAAPGIYSGSDTDTGIYSPGSNQFGITTNGTSRVVVDASGNVGIGASAPDGYAGKFLQIHDAGARSSLRLTNGNSGATKDDGFEIESRDGYVQINYRENGYMSFLTNNSERMRIDSSGNVAIGTTATGGYSTNTNFFIGGAGNLYADTAAAANGSISLSHNAYINSSGNWVYRVADEATNYYQSNGVHGWRYASAGSAGGAISWSTAMHIDSSGNVGIGLTNPGDYHANANSLVSSGGITLANTTMGSIFFADSATGTGEYVGQLNYDHGSDFMQFTVNASERLRIDSSGRVGINTTSPAEILHITGNPHAIIRAQASSATAVSSLYFGDPAQATAGYLQYAHTTDHLEIGVANSEKVRVAANGNVAIGSTNTTFRFNVNSGSTATNTEFLSSASSVYLKLNNSTNSLGYVGYEGSSLGFYADNDRHYQIYADGTHLWSRGGTESARINSSGTVMIPNTGGFTSVAGHTFYASGQAMHATNTDTLCLLLNRQHSDGTLLDFRQASSSEGSVSVSGSTVSYNGGHLSRWSQLAGGAKRIEILRGSVLSNLDEMCEWAYEAQDAVLWTEEDKPPEGINVGDIRIPARVAGIEENEQLNRMKVSDTEGDKNVAGVFQCWDDDDDVYTDDFYCAVTGDFIIRIAQGTTVARGDLLMSAGDGTAKPQDDDIVRSKTVAKVTSTTVSTTYADGSYCVPCVLMAC